MWIETKASSYLLKLVKPAIRAHYHKLLKRGDLVFDVGANVGELTEVFSELGARVIAIEPHPYCVEILKQRFQRNNNVKILAVGASDSVGSARFYISGDYHTTSTFSKTWVTQSRYRNRFIKGRQPVMVRVPTTTLDELISSYGVPNFCKVDVEGYELNVLKGLSQKIPLVSFEFVSEFLEDAEKCMQHLGTLGEAEFNYSLFINYTFASRTWISAAKVIKRLARYPKKFLSGDIYARMT